MTESRAIPAALKRLQKRAKKIERLIGAITKAQSLGDAPVQVDVIDRAYSEVSVALAALDGEADA